MKVQATINLDDEQRTAFAMHLKCSRDAKVLAPKIREWMIRQFGKATPEVMEAYLEGRLEDLRKGRAVVSDGMKTR